MIADFKCDETEKVFLDEFSRKLPQSIQPKANTKLHILDNAVNLNDICIFSGNRLEKLHGDRKGQYSIRINKQWRICFEWHEGNAYSVEIVDYH